MCGWGGAGQVLGRSLKTSMTWKWRELARLDGLRCFPLQVDCREGPWEIKCSSHKTAQVAGPGQILKAVQDS